MKIYGMVAALFCLTSAAGAEVKSKVVDYKQGDTPLQGLLAWDDAAKGKKPGILVVHEWWGNNEHARNQALRLAKAGYVAFALDMYGKGKRSPGRRCSPHSNRFSSPESSEDAAHPGG